MNKNSVKYTAYVQILKEELIPAMGCTEPVAIAYAAAKARVVLGIIPERVLIQASGSLIKNVKSVIVPNTGNMKGIEAAAAAGIVAGVPERELEVISRVSVEQIQAIQAYVKAADIQVEHIEDGHVFDIILTAYAGASWTRVRISDYHTNIVWIEKDGRALWKQEAQQGQDGRGVDRTLLNLADIYDFAHTCDIRDVSEVLERQIKYNTAIAEEGLRGEYGANVGRTLLKAYGNGILTRVKAKAAAGSDARMNGCEMPVVINSGSGNQGITCSVPVIEYAEELGASHEQLLRALALSNLIAIHEKTGIGTLSAYCGAVSSAAGAGGGIVYLCGGDYKAVSDIITSLLATISGIVCDGAKASCASKIAESVDMAMLGFHMWKNGQTFRSGDGLVAEDVEHTIRNIGRLGRVGMKETNNEIIAMMINT
ncbi:serine dehydratase subunit alpha family protein [Enterocloster asparagiformis]|uniref:L-cysteine desulfidase family protein n=1 Tax=Enterocloster asparagiformis TaxID=333367 RepID=UPI002A841E53|nr:L-serine ammonia-lyase, iron-sulfur-dependent, subunit alpha [Enterocloster asparagiformis]